MGLMLVDPAGTSPVTLAEARAVCKVTGTAEDTRLQLWLPMAVLMVEDEIGKALGSQTWLLTLDHFADAIDLPRGPATALDGITYLDTSGVQQELDPGLYMLDLVSDPQQVVRNSDASWPAVLDRRNAIEITFTTGYVSGAREYDAVRTAVLSLIQHWFDGAVAGTMPPGVSDMLSPYHAQVVA